MEPLTEASKVARANLVDPGECRTLSEDAPLLRPLVGRDFQVWELPAHNARDGKTRRNWRLGVRLGAAASGVYSQRVSDLDAASPGIRKAGSREMVVVLRSPGQAGYPPSIATDAHLGFLVMAYQSAEVLFDRCEGQGCIHLRPGPPREHEGRHHPTGGGRKLALLYPPYPCGGTLPLCGRRVLRQQSAWPLGGPLFGCNPLCAGQWAFSTVLDWAAQPLILEAPTLFNGIFGSAHMEWPTKEEKEAVLGQNAQ